MAVEKLTDKQIRAADEAEGLCQMSLDQTMKQAVAEQMKKAKEAVDKVQQQLAEFPENAIKDLNDAIKLLISIISGNMPANDKSFDPKVVIAQLEAMLKPVLSALSSLPVPEIPGLAQIADILAALKAFMSSLGSQTEKTVSTSQAQIPPELNALLRDLLGSIVSMTSTLPLVLINLVWQMFNAIIGMFKQIAGVIGVPSIPFPLNLVPNCIAMMPDLMQFMLKAPCQIVGATCSGLMNAFGQITSMQIPSMPDRIELPKPLPSCPVHSSASKSKQQ